MSPILKSSIYCLSILITASPSISQDLPKVTPPTPEAVALFKYLDYPVNYSTGIPEISIPLYEIKSGSLTVPITLNYHSSGRKVYDETGAVGLGWTLSAGGMISRTIYGEPDDNDYIIKFPSPWKKQADINPIVASGADFLEGVYSTSYNIPWYDTEYDFFSYSTGSISGKFVLRDDNNIKTPVLIPKKPYKIQYHKANTQFNINYFDQISIIDDKGTLFQFGKSLKDGIEYLENSSGVGKTGWMLTEIISADKIDTVFFKYQVFVKAKREVSQKTVVTDRWGDCSFAGESVSQEQYGVDDGLGTFNDINNAIQRLVEIKFRNGKVAFNLESGLDRIVNMSVSNSKNQNVRVIEFNTSTQDALSDGNAPTKKLNSIIIKDEASTIFENYHFDYYPTIYNNSSQVDGRFRDFWGYYNASGKLIMRPLVSNISFIGIVPQTISIGDPGAARSPSLSGAMSGVLKSVTFPTGGSKEFLYEQNKYWDVQTSQINACGGLRLYQTITNDGANNISYKTYKYGVSESGYGELPFVPSVNNMFTETHYQGYFDGSSGGGLCNGCADVANRTRIYSADVLPIFNDFLQRPVYYEAVTEYFGTEANNIGKAVYKYDKGNIFSVPNSAQGLFSSSDPKYWKENSLIEKSEFKRVNTAYQLVKKTTNTYQETVYEAEKIWGLHVGKLFYKSPLTVTDPYTGLNIPTYRYKDPAHPSCSSDDGEVFIFSDYTLSIGKKDLVTSLDSTYFDNGTALAKRIEYKYNTNHLLSKTKEGGSRSDTLITENKYPFDFLPSTVYSAMMTRNMVNYPVEVNSYRNNIPLVGTKTDYKDWGNNNIKPEIVSLKQGNSAYEPRVIIHSYDQSGNLQCVSKDDGGKISYLFGYRNEFPIAEVINASPNQIYYNGFEELDGNSTENDAKTGRRSHTGGYTKTITELSNGDYYLSYFQKVSGLWTPFRINVSIAVGTYNLSLSGQLDEVRLYPVAATMTTYTYDLLQGVTTATDTNNQSTYFEYDPLGRLIVVKDSDRNIKTNYSYHFK